MKVLGIMGSPRRGGNTDMLLSWIMAGVEMAGGETETVYLHELTIKECDGCLACWKKHPCPKKDDMNILYEKIAESDAYVFGTPVYWYGPTALMKGFIDRWVYFNYEGNRPQVRGKSALLAVPYEESDPVNGEAVAEFFQRSLNYLEMRLAGSLLIGEVGEKGAVRKNKAWEEDCIRLGRMLAEEVE